MKWLKTKNIALAIMTLLGLSEIPINAEEKKTDFSAEAIEKLKAEFGEDYAVKMKEALDSELQEMLGKNLQLKAIQDELDALIKEKDLKSKELERAQEEGEDNDEILAKVKIVTEATRKTDQKVKELESLVSKLITDPEGDVPEAVVKNFKNQANNPGMKIVHSNTHLFASGKSYDAFEGRPWNARFKDGSMKATDFISDSNIPTLQGDMEHFVRENPQLLNSLFNDYADLPKEWDRRSGVLDRVSDGYILPDEIVQGRSKGWKPKNKFKLDSETGRVFRKKIDISFDGYELQEIENTWIRSYNKEGSHPWKMSFVGFLLSELVKRQKLDDRRAQINGIYVETPEGEGNPGAAINSQDGLLYLFYYHREVTQKYKPFDLGLPTEENIVDYIEDMIKSMPEVERNESGYEIGISSKWLKAYRTRAGNLYQHHYNTDTGKHEYKESYPIDRPNFKFQELVDMVKTDFIYITKSNNIQILDYNVSEKGKFTVTHEKRDTHIFADYRLGIRIKYVGMKRANDEPADFELQKVWSNNVPIFGNEVAAPAFDDTSGILKLHYPVVKIDSDWNTDITKIEGDKDKFELVPGMIVKIIGNTNAGAKKVKHNANTVLTGNADFSLDNGGTLTLIVGDDLKLKELYRTSAPEAPESQDVDFNTPVIDANDGKVFKFTGTEDTTMTGILNGVEHKTITIYGNATPDADLVLSTGGNISMSSTATLAAATHYVQLMLVDGKWRDIKRLTT
jgi:hypothetical protein